jgi:hypothetical protein
MPPPRSSWHTPRSLSMTYHGAIGCQSPGTTHALGRVAIMRYHNGWVCLGLFQEDDSYWIAKERS